MAVIEFPVIDLAATGENITKLRKDKGLSVRDIQAWFGFEGPQAIYKWQHGLCLPTVDNLIALSALLGVPMDQILVLRGEQSNREMNGQQAESCCSDYFCPLRLFQIRQESKYTSANCPAPILVLTIKAVRVISATVSGDHSGHHV